MQHIIDRSKDCLDRLPDPRFAPCVQPQVNDQESAIPVLIDGTADWTIGALVGTSCFQEPTPAVPFYSDMGTTSAPFAIWVEGSTACRLDTHRINEYEYSFEVKAAVGDATYIGGTPFSLTSSQVLFDLPEDEASWPQSGSHWGVGKKEKCAMHSTKDLLSAYEKAYEWLTDKLAEFAAEGHPASVEIHYLRMIDGTYLYTLNAEGTARVAFETLGGAISAWKWEVTAVLDSVGANQIILEGKGKSYGISPETAGQLVPTYEVDGTSSIH